MTKNLKILYFDIILFVCHINLRKEHVQRIFINCTIKTEKIQYLSSILFILFLIGFFFLLN